MKKHYFLFILFMSLCNGYAQELIQEAEVSKAYVGNGEEWQNASFKTPGTIFSNR